MEEFKQLSWSMMDVGTDLEETYALNMPDHQRSNPTDVFFCHLMEINPLHLQHTHQSSNNDRNSFDAIPKQYIDPRTGVEIPSQMCIYSDVDWETKSIFLRNLIHPSKLYQREHVACLNALRSMGKPELELSIEEMKDRLLYKSTASQRLEEKTKLLDELEKHYFAKLSHRYHNVPPAINHFIVENWKRRLISMHRELARCKYQMRTAVALQQSEGNNIVKVVKIHQEYIGNVPKMIDKDVAYLRQSSSNLTIAYNARKNTHLLPVISRKVEELIQMHDVDIVVPISVLKILLGVKMDWACCMRVNGTDASTAFNSKKEIVFEKLLPPTYLSGNDRYRKGAKYLLHSCLNQNSLSVFNHNEKTEHKTGIETEMIERNSDALIETEYKVTSCDEFIKNYPSWKASYENATFTIFDVTGRDVNDENETFKVLVPAKQAAYHKGQNDEIQFVNYCAKIEFQTEYGAEVMSKAELISEWCDLYFRPGTINERVRFECIRGKVICRLKRTLADVESELNEKCGIETQQLLQRLFHAFQTFCGFPVGAYLLKNDAKKLDCVKVYEKCNDSADGLDISKIVKVTSFEQNLMDKAEWLPIDDQIVTGIHEKYHMLPCAFPHPEHLKEYHLLPLKSECVKYTKTKRAEMEKICPKDDSLDVLNKVRAKKKVQLSQFQSKQNEKKNLKRLRKRTNKKLEKLAADAEDNGLKSAKKLLLDTLDQFTISSAAQEVRTGHQTHETPSSSTAVGTQRHLRYGHQLD